MKQKLTLLKITMEIEAGERAHQTKVLTTKSARQHKIDP